MKLTVVGCTGSMSGPQSPASSYLIQETDEDGRLWSIVLDMGPGTFGSLWRIFNERGYNIHDGQAIDAVMFSHWHADHCSDLLSYQIFRRWHPTVKMPIQHIYSPGGGLKRVRQLDGFTDEDGFPEFAFHDFEVIADQGNVPIGGIHVNIGPIRVIPFSAYHSVPAVSLRCESTITGQVITYSGDTDYCAALVESAKDADVLLADCGFTENDKVAGIHMSGVRAGRVAREAGVSMLVPTHIQPWTDPKVPIGEARREFSGDIIAAYQGLEIDLG